MPRNGAGVFAVLNPILVGALRSSSAVNADFVDAGDEITGSLPLDGQAGMTGQFKAANVQTGTTAIERGAIIFCVESAVRPLSLGASVIVRPW